MQPYPGGYSPAPQQPAPQLWLPPGPEMPQRRWQRQSKWWVVGFSVVLALILAVVTIVALALSTTFDTEGRIRLPESMSTTTTNGECRGIGTANELEVGTTVAVLDAQRNELARGSIDRATTDTLSCVLHYKVSDVPAGQTNYYLAIGTMTERFTESELRSGVNVEP